MYSDKEEKKKKILDYLKGKDEVPTSELTGMLGINFYRLKRILEELEKEGSISQEAKGSFVYWKLRKKK